MEFKEAQHLGYCPLDGKVRNLDSCTNCGFHACPRRGEQAGTFHFSFEIEKGKGMAMNDDFEDVLRDLDKAIMMNPNDDELLLYKGAVLNAFGRNKEAIECLDKALEINPDNVKAQKGRMICLRELKMSELRS